MEGATCTGHQQALVGAWRHTLPYAANSRTLYIAADRPYSYILVTFLKTYSYFRNFFSKFGFLFRFGFLVEKKLSVLIVSWPSDWWFSGKFDIFKHFWARNCELCWRLKCHETTKPPIRSSWNYQNWLFFRQRIQIRRENQISKKKFENNYMFSKMSPVYI